MTADMCVAKSAGITKYFRHPQGHGKDSYFVLVEIFEDLVENTRNIDRAR